VLAAPIYSGQPADGRRLIIVVFAVVVIGGMGSILGAIVTGFGLGLVEGLTKVFYPEASAPSSSSSWPSCCCSSRPACSGAPHDRGRPETWPSRSSAKPHAGMPRCIVIFIGMLALLLVAPFQFYPVFLMKVLCFALFASAFNLLLGFGGLLSFGHAAYFGTASYIAAHAAKVWGLTPELAILSGTAVAGVLGLAFGSLAIRRQGIYFAMVTWRSPRWCISSPCRRRSPGARTASRRCRAAIVRRHQLRSDLNLYYVVLAVFFLGGFLIIYRIIHSPFGQVLKAIRENEPRAISLGYNTDRYKLMVFTCRPTLPAWPGRPRPSCSSSPRSPTCTGPCRARWC
jgi:branched-chain amino acid transport system permease protein